MITFIHDIAVPVLISVIASLLMFRVLGDIFVVIIRPR